MGDLSDKGSSESEEMNIKTPERSSSDGNQARTCADCGTTKTPLWRGGPAGPKSLCNACGIRSRKRRRALLGLNKQSTEEKKSKKANSNIMIKSGNSSSSSSSGTSRSNSINNKLGESIKRKLKALGDEVVLQRSTVDKLISRKLLGEEERAAILLMALSCGSVYA